MLEQRLEEEAAVVDFLVDGVVGGETRFAGAHPSRQGIVLVTQVYREHSRFEVHREPFRNINHLQKWTNTLVWLQHSHIFLFRPVAAF